MGVTTDSTTVFAEHIAAMTAQARVLRLPALVKGALVFPPRVTAERLVAQFAHVGEHDYTRFTLDGQTVQALRYREPGGARYVVTPWVDPATLPEHDLDALHDHYFAQPLASVLDGIGRVQEVLQSGGDALAGLAPVFAGSQADARLAQTMLGQLPALFDRDAVAASVAREFGAGPGGEAVLDGWVALDAATYDGMTTRLNAQMFPEVARPADDAAPAVRAMPTRQLHIAAGNSPFIPVLSFLRAVACKGAAVIKSPSDALLPLAIVAAALDAAAADTPLVRHTSFVYWPGGDAATEARLLAPGAFDRVVAWGGQEAINSIAGRIGALGPRAILLKPRYGVSLIGRAAWDSDQTLRTAAIHACADSLAGNQAACFSSLVHYVEADEAGARAYCEVLRDVLARWDDCLPAPMSSATVGRLRLAQRSTFLSGSFFSNGATRAPSSAVVYQPEAFDVQQHPMCRCIVVRPLPSADAVTPLLSDAVSTVGVYPEPLRARLRDRIAARGVSTILPLGAIERAYAGMPHDGMYLLRELVNWVNA